jgi:hypothetical protein
MIHELISACQAKYNLFSSQRQLFTAFLVAFSCFATGQLATAQVLINESFRNATSTAFTLRNNAALTAASGTDADGSGYLRLTTSATSQRGAVISNTAFSAAQGFNISFEFFAYGSTSGADGYSVFLIDGSTPVATFSPGAFGSSLGYAPATVNSVTTPGATNGYLGIGLDEYGGFNSNNEGKSGGNTLVVRNTVAVRGNAAGGYALLTPALGASNTGSSLSVTTTRAQSGVADYRRVNINVTPTGGTFRITVRIQNGANVVTAINSFLLATAPPPTLRLGIAASTGGLTNTHELRNLYVVVPPTAANDNAVTPNNTPVTLNILSNDNSSISTFDYASIDLDPSTIAIERSVTVAGGTFSVSPTTGLVTFTPSSANSVGSFSIPYVVSTTAGTGPTGVPATPTNPATITVQVGGSGADIATSISGPATVPPGSSLSYTVTTTNLGTTSASTIVPRLTLSQNLPLTSALPSGASYSNGVLTFPTTSNLAANGGNVTYTVTFAAPASTSTVTAIASATTSSLDLNGANNDGSATNSRTTTDVSRPLGVQLLSFEAQARGATVELAWRTGSEQNNAHFLVERSLDGTNFTAMAQLAGRGTSAQSTAYSYADHTVGQVATTILYYRLRQVDTDGTATLSPVQVVQRPLARGPVLRYYPNPMQDQVTLDLTTWPATPCLVQLLDLAGRLQYQQTKAGGQLHPLTFSSLAPGTYVLQVRSQTQQQSGLLVR